ncbi:MAG: hypothetical protein ACREIC_18665 [Limisphaerales bacterium]
MFPAKAKPATTSVSKKPAPPTPKPERSMEQRIADEVARRMNDKAGNFVLGFLIGEGLVSWWDKHHKH